MIRGILDILIVVSLALFLLDQTCQHITKDRCTYGVPNPKRTE